MRAPLEYGDNFPVAAGSWDPTVPWRFPRTEPYLQRRSLLSRALPWITLGVGVTLGVLWMSWQMDLPGKGTQETQDIHAGIRQGELLLAPPTVPAKAAPSARPYRVRSRVA